jgi:hypothetical protein
MAESRCRARDEHGYPADCDGPLCFYCLEGAERDVRALVLDYRDLEQHLAPSLGQRGSGLPTGRGGLPPLPIAEHVLDLQIDIFRMTDAWDDVVRDFDRLSDKPTRTRAGWAVQQSVSVLAPRLDRLAQTSAEMWDYPGAMDRCSEVPGWQGVLDLAHLHQRARHTLGLTRESPTLLVGVPCKGCNAATLYRYPGEDGAVCGRCGLYYSAGDYAAWTSLLAVAVKRSRAA